MEGQIYTHTFLCRASDKPLYIKRCVHGDFLSVYIKEDDPSVYILKTPPGLFNLTNYQCPTCF